MDLNLEFQQQYLVVRVINMLDVVTYTEKKFGKHYRRIYYFRLFTDNLNLFNKIYQKKQRHQYCQPGNCFN